MALGTAAPGVPVVVTGASAGIGEALAAELAARGHDLVLVARRRDRLRALARRLREREHVDVEIRPADLADPEQRRALAAELADRQLAGLCNNAGVGSYGPYLDAEPGHLAAMVELNASATNDLMAAVLPGLVARGEGAVLNVASILGHGAQPHNAAYAATKAFAITLSEAVHAELAGTGVSVTALSPGPVRTDIYDSSDAADLQDIGPSLLWQEPDEVARAAVDAMERGERTAVPGLVNALAAAGGRYLPQTIRLPLQQLLAGALPEVRRRLRI
jgi:short-subunit dehydrogenase